ncbi:unnamed protein product [Urochloa humidicola]
MSDPEEDDACSLLCVLSTLLCEVWECVQFWTPLCFTVILFWLLYRPDLFYPSVDSAILTAPANASDQPSLRYDLAVDLSLRNSHKCLSIRYLDISATAFYNGSTKLGPADDAFPTPFRQGPKNTTVFHPMFRGTVAVSSIVRAELERELAAGTMHLRVRVTLTLKYKLWPVNEIDFYDYDYDYWLWFSLPRDAVPAVFDAGTRCWAIMSEDN